MNRRQQRLFGRVRMDARNVSECPVVLDHVDHRPVGQERYHQPSDDVDEIVERDERRQAVGEVRKKGERVALPRQGQFGLREPQRPLGNNALGYVDRMPEDVRPAQTVRHDVAVHPQSV